MPPPPSQNPQFPQVNISFGKLFAAVIAILLLAAAATSFFEVPENSQAVVLRLGKKQPVLQPGLHFKLPLGIDKVDVVEVAREKTLEFGVRGSKNNDWEREQDMVTGDLNAVNVPWVVRYRISDPVAYLFNVRNPEPTLSDASESIMREVVGDRTVDEVLTEREVIGQEAFQKLRERVDEYGMGMEIIQIQLKELKPPQALNAAFQDVNKAEQEKKTKINEANRDYLSTIPKARGEAERKVAEAEGYATERINRAQGDASRFTALFEEYQKAPEVTKRRLYLETLQEVVPKLGEKIVIDEDTQQVLPLLNLGKQKP